MIFQILLYQLHVAISCLCGQEIEEPTEGTPTHSESTAYESQPPNPINQPQASQKPDWQYSDMREAIANKDTSQKKPLKAIAEMTRVVSSEYFP